MPSKTLSGVLRGVGIFAQTFGQALGKRVVGLRGCNHLLDDAGQPGLDFTELPPRFLVADVQVAPLGGPYDMAFSRFGTMFFANPVAALRMEGATLLGKDGNSTARPVSL